MTHHLTESQLIELRGAFSFFDQENNGLITTSSLRSSLQKLGFYPTDDQLEQMINSVISNTDVNIDSQVIDFPEFLVMMAKVLERSDAETELRESFKLLDRDGNGELELDELYDVLQGLGEDYTYAEVKQMMDFADFNQDEVISFDEFVKMMLSPDDGLKRSKAKKVNKKLKNRLNKSGNGDNNV